MLDNENFVSYFASYGPTSSNICSYDDHVGKKIKKNKITNPITLPNKYIDEVFNEIKTVNHGVFLISGTAGDGKTYLIRQIWIKLGNDEDCWNKSKNWVKITYDSKTIVFIKDLSAVVDDSSEDFELMRLIATTSKEDNSIIVIIAANNGQILKKFKNYTYKSINDTDILEFIESVFLDNKDGKYSDFAFYIKDLRDVCDSTYINMAIDEVTSNERWNICQTCELHELCPIERNAEKLRRDKVFREQLISILEIILAKGYHITTRNLLLLLSNICLGHESKTEKHKIKILTCNDIKKSINSNIKISSNIYNNALGLNLTETQRNKIGIFAEIASLKIGFETSKNIDAFISSSENDIKLSGNQNLQSEFYDYITKLPVDLKEAFNNSKHNYLNRDTFNLDESVELSEYNKAITDCRVCLFFNKQYSKLFNLWELSVYKNGESYLKLLKQCRNKQDTCSITSHRELIIGLNKIFTGFYTTESKTLYISTSGGYSKFNVCSIYLEEIRPRKSGFLIAITCSDDRLKLPQIKIYAKDRNFNSIYFTLTPPRYEFLMSVANGKLHSSFSSECLDDILSFKVKLVSCIESYNAYNDVDNSTEPLELVSVDNKGNLRRE